MIAIMITRATFKHILTHHPKVMDLLWKRAQIKHVSTSGATFIIKR